MLSVTPIFYQSKVYSSLRGESPFVQLSVLARQLLEFPVVWFAEVRSAGVTDVDSAVSHLVWRDRTNRVSITTYDAAVLALCDFAHGNHF